MPHLHTVFSNVRRATSFCYNSVQSPTLAFLPFPYGKSTFPCFMIEVDTHALQALLEVVEAKAVLSKVIRLLNTFKNVAMAS